MASKPNFFFKAYSSLYRYVYSVIHFLTLLFILFIPERLKTWIKLFFTSSYVISAQGFLAIITKSFPESISSFNSVIAWRTMRLIRLRTTAFPIFLLTERPMRKFGCSSLSNWYTTNWRFAFDFPFEKPHGIHHSSLYDVFSSYQLTLLYFISGNSLLLEKDHWTISGLRR